MCGIIDTWKTMPGKSDHQHPGLMTPTGEFYAELEEAVRHADARNRSHVAGCAWPQ